MRYRGDPEREIRMDIFRDRDRVYVVRPNCECSRTQDGGKYCQECGKRIFRDVDGRNVESLTIKVELPGWDVLKGLEAVFLEKRKASKKEFDKTILTNCVKEWTVSTPLVFEEGRWNEDTYRRVDLEVDPDILEGIVGYVLDEIGR